MPQSEDYLVIHIRVSRHALVKHQFLGKTREDQIVEYQTYFATLGLLPWHGCKTITEWEDPATNHIHYRQQIPREPYHHEYPHHSC